MPDPVQKPRPEIPVPLPAPGSAPAVPKVSKPDVGDLLKRMRKVDPEQARRYRQRTGQ